MLSHGVLVDHYFLCGGAGPQDPTAAVPAGEAPPGLPGEPQLLPAASGSSEAPVEGWKPRVARAGETESQKVNILRTIFRR